MIEDYKDLLFRDFVELLEGKKQPEDLGLTKEKWFTFRDEYDAENPTPKGLLRLTKHQKAVHAKAMVTKLTCLYQCVYPFTEDYKEYFEAAGVRLKGDYEQSVRNLKKLINKETTKFEIRSAEYLQHLEQEKENEEVEKNDRNRTFYDALAELGVITGLRLDPNTTTVGEVMAHQRTARNIAKQRNKKNG